MCEDINEKTTFKVRRGTPLQPHVLRSVSTTTNLNARQTDFVFKILVTKTVTTLLPFQNKRTSYCCFVFGKQRSSSLQFKGWTRKVGLNKFVIKPTYLLLQAVASCHVQKKVDVMNWMNTWNLSDYPLFYCLVVFVCVQDSPSCCRILRLLCWCWTAPEQASRHQFCGWWWPFSSDVCCLQGTQWRCWWVSEISQVTSFAILCLVYTSKALNHFISICSYRRAPLQCHINLLHCCTN